MREQPLPILEYEPAKTRQRWFHWWVLPLAWLAPVAWLAIVGKVARSFEVAAFPGLWAALAWPVVPSTVTWVCACCVAGMMTMSIVGLLMDALRIRRGIYLWLGLADVMLLVSQEAGPSHRSDPVQAPMMACVVFYFAVTGMCLFAAARRLSERGRQAGPS